MVATPLSPASALENWRPLLEYGGGGFEWAVHTKVRVRVRVRVGPNPTPTPYPNPNPTPTSNPNPNPNPKAGHYASGWRLPKAAPAGRVCPVRAAVVASP